MSFIEEKVIDLDDGQDPDQLIESIKKMGPEYVAANEQTIIGEWPNTYTFTKSMAERSLKKHRGSLRCAIVRPSIITSCYEEPCRGWTDTIGAGGGTVFTMQAGLAHFLYGIKKTVLDLIPCDTVTNQIITATCYTALPTTPDFNVMHACSSALNPTTNAEQRINVLNAVKYNPYHREFSKPHAMLLENRKVFELANQVGIFLPTKIAGAYASVTRNKSLQKNVRLLDKVQKKIYEMQTLFHHFAVNTWIFDSSLVVKLMSMMNE